uniref:ATP dependent Clp protease ATP binding subunit clpA-like protein subunit B n=1 Tax=Neustupella aerophytica TaxID=2962111 RepID=UPI0021824218|nr:ATP dependent Clp protease ATP binding subunit clpA-like protein subunit B [Neustupella aerophytica]YP_010478879.1 ATP dependent Clp protease ATP binding subunit clpA-like protein subunit B [Neustupella aerophytica]UVI61106.1 ATP dependent Clp protease ATP binding subunit clpA-like protein subunit B [Neustupella aerophytica]UVI61184.1 ATP dependent Clp protease ATP binding subunit clpA-like protein subunit B [Neustupella aerophytica]
MGKRIQPWQIHRHQLPNVYTVFSTTSIQIQTKALEAYQTVCNFILTFDMALEKNMNIITAKQNLPPTEDDDVIYTVGGKLVVKASDVAEVVALWTGLPATNLTRDQAERFLHLEKDLGNRIIGQDHAIAVVAKSLRRYAAGLRNPKRPIGSFLLCGPTGVGKTELTKQLAEYLFGSQKALIRLDMSEYMEKHTVARLIGSPPGYVGFEEGGQLTDAVRSRPYSIVLFDEIEKAHPDVYNVLLQILDDGILSDSTGRTVSFQNTLIILTSNLGSQTILEFCAQKPTRTPEEEVMLKKLVTQTLGSKFRPEFLNRLDDIVIFHPLSRDHISTIAFILLDEIDERLERKGFHLLVTGRLLTTVRQEGFNSMYGARPLRRAISKWVEDPIAEKLLHVENEIEFGSSFLVDLEDSDPGIPQVLVLPPGLREEIQARNHGMIVAPTS